MSGFLNAAERLSGQGYDISATPGSVLKYIEISHRAGYTMRFGISPEGEETPVHKKDMEFFRKFI
ncbi:MAG TPA: hypothetical protein VI968_01655 [archaeon]|nr:hypothetical protein [archaeon]